MAASTSPLIVSGNLNFPPSTGLPNLDIPFSGSTSYTQPGHDRLALSGSSTHSVDLGTVGAPGLKAIGLLLEDDGAASPINLRFNGGTDDWEVSRGGFILYFSPAPATGITALSIVHTSDACVRLWFYA